MAATAVQISTYLTNIYTAQARYMDKLILKEKLGYPDIERYRLTATVLNGYVDIITEYFSQATYSGGYFVITFNFFDELEAEDLMLRINKICDTNYYVNLD